MGTGYQGASAIAWTQTCIEGVPAEPEVELAEGMTWSWHGQAQALDRDPATLLLTASRDLDELRTRAARVVRKLLQHPAPSPAELVADDETEPLYRGAFIVSDNVRFFTVVPMGGAGEGPSLLLFLGDPPPQGRALIIVHCDDQARPPAPSPRAMICFTPGTRIRTPDGPVAIEDLGPGDHVLTRDNGPKEVLWQGHRRMSGARLFAMPAIRPVRLRAGAFGRDRPDGDLVVSPDHRILLGGSASRDLWNEAEVLVRAADLVGDRYVTRDHSLRETFYIHLLLERHEVIWANGLEVESFHPGFAALDDLDGLQRRTLFEASPGLAADPELYGAPARRMLSRAEAAIMIDGAPTKAIAPQH